MHDKLTTEAANPDSADLDRLGTLELVRLINREDAKIAAAVAAQAENIAAAVEIIAQRLASGGRLIYIGAGTSGRLGVLDASECPPTFNADPAQVIGLIAGGDTALRHAVEGAEDSAELAVDALRELKLSDLDAVVGIAASGTTAFVLGGLDEARATGAAAIGLTCNHNAPIANHADLTIAVVAGAEVLAGSTRMKAGTATKMVLNILTTATMVQLGKTYGNLMVDLHASNEKLIGRSLRILQQLTGLEACDARALLAACDGELKTAVISKKLDIDAATARERLLAVGGRLREALGEHA